MGYLTGKVASTSSFGVSDFRAGSASLGNVARERSRDGGWTMVRRKYGAIVPGLAILAASCGQTASKSDSSAPLSCTTAMADLSFNVGFDIDTGFLPSTVGAAYGQSACPNEYLLDVDLNGPLKSQSFSISAQWSDSLSPNCTGLNATMTVFALPRGTNTAWQIWDQVGYQNSGDSCAASTISHTNTADDGQEGATITPSNGFSQLRVAVNATQTTPSPTHRVAVLVFGTPDL
jgi:hypothetical protein